MEEIGTHHGTQADVGLRIAGDGEGQRRSACKLGGAVCVAILHPGGDGRLPGCKLQSTPYALSLQSILNHLLKLLPSVKMFSISPETVTVHLRPLASQLA